MLAMFPALLGSSEHRLPGSLQRLLARLNAALRDEADDAGIGLLALDDRVARDGLTAWHDPMLWHSAMQEVSPAAAPTTASCWRPNRDGRASVWGSISTTRYGAA